VKNKKIYMNYSFFRIFAATGAILLVAGFIAMCIFAFDVNGLTFFAIMTPFYLIFTFIVWYPGVFIDYEKNVFTIRTMEGLGTLKLPLDEVKSVTGTVNGHGRLMYIEFRIVQKNGYIYRRDLHCTRMLSNYESLKSRVEELFPPEEAVEAVKTDEYEEYEDYEE